MRGFRGLFFVCFATLCLLIDVACAVDSLSVEDEAEIFGGSTAEGSFETEDGVYAEPYARDRKQIEQKPADRGDVYLDLYAKAKRQNEEERDVSFYDSLFANSLSEGKREDTLFDSYRNMTDDCARFDKELDESVKVFKSVLSLQNIIGILENEGACYRDIGYAVIEGLYDGDETLWQAFENESKRFYLQAGSVDFDAKHCGDNCSVKALVAAQKEKFGAFREYLYHLIDEAEQKDATKIKGQNRDVANP